MFRRIAGDGLSAATDFPMDNERKGARSFLILYNRKKREIKGARSFLLTCAVILHTIETRYIGTPENIHSRPL